MPVLTLSALFHFMLHTDTNTASGSSNFEKCAFKDIKNIKIDATTFVNMMTILSGIEEKSSFHFVEFYRIPEKYHKMAVVTQKFCKVGQGVTPKEFQRVTGGRHFNKTFTNLEISLNEVLNLEHIDDTMTMGEYIGEIDLMGGTSNFLIYLRHTAIVFANSFDFEADFSIFLMILICPLQKFFKEKGAGSYAAVMGYLGTNPQHITNDGDFAASSSNSKVTPSFIIALDVECLTMLALLTEPHKFFSYAEIETRMRSIYKQLARTSSEMKERVKSVLNKYKSVRNKRTTYRMDINDLAAIRAHVSNSFNEALKVIENTRANKNEPLINYTKQLFFGGFQDWSKWEISHRILQEIFPTKVAPVEVIAPVEVTAPVEVNVTGHAPNNSINCLKPIQHNGPSLQFVLEGYPEDGSQNWHEARINDTINYNGNYYYLSSSNT